MVWGVTDWPEGAVLVTAGLGPGLAPVLTTNTSNVGVAAGTGEQSKAHPMFQVPPAMLNTGLVQSPVSWVAGTKMLAGASATGVVVDEPPAPPAVVVEVELPEPPAVVVEVELPAPPAVVVEVELPAPPAVVVEVELPEPAAVVVEVELLPLGAGSLYVLPPPVPELAEVADPVVPLNHIPTTAATITATTSCQVFQDRPPLRWSEPGSGRVSSNGSPADWASVEPGADADDGPGGAGGGGGDMSGAVGVGGWPGGGGCTHGVSSAISRTCPARSRRSAGRPDW